MIKNKEKRERRKKTVPIWIGILVFIGAFIIGILSKLLIQPSWMADYSMKWSEKIGTKLTGISYGEGELNKYDLYLPKDSSKANYGLVVYIHAVDLLPVINRMTMKGWHGYVRKDM